MHDLNQQLKANKKLQHYTQETEDDYYIYFKTNIDKVRCRRTYCCKKDKFEYYNFTLIMMNDAYKFTSELYNIAMTLEDGFIDIDTKTNTVMFNCYAKNNVRLFITENNYELSYSEMSINDYKKYRNERTKNNLDKYMIEYYE